MNMSAVNEAKALKLLGYTTDFNQCDCCGKENLKGTVCILDLRYDVILHYGTVCAAAADKFDTLDAARAMKTKVQSLTRKISEFKNDCQRAAFRALKNTSPTQEQIDALATEKYNAGVSDLIERHVNAEEIAQQQKDARRLWFQTDWTKKCQDFRDTANLMGPDLWNNEEYKSLCAEHDAAKNAIINNFSFSKFLYL